MCYLSACVFPLFDLLFSGNSSSIHIHTGTCRARYITSQQRGFGGVSIAVQPQKNKPWRVLCMSSFWICFLLFVAVLCIHCHLPSISGCPSFPKAALALGLVLLAEKNSCTFGGEGGLGSCRRSLQEPAAAKDLLSVEAEDSGDRDRVRMFFKQNDLDWPCGSLLWTNSI